MSDEVAVEGLLRELAPQALSALVRRYGDFSDAEDAVQDALLQASQTWPAEGLPQNPAGWLIRVAVRRLIEKYRSSDARKRREDLAASMSIDRDELTSSADDSLLLLFMCCHNALSSSAAVALTLRAVGGLTTREIANAYVVPEATMAQRISRAKSKIRDAGDSMEIAFREYVERLPYVQRVLYLIFNEGYTTSEGVDLTRVELSTEAIRLGRLLVQLVPDDAESKALLALMLLTDARRTARADASGFLIPLDEQDRSLWNRASIAEGLELLNGLQIDGEYGMQAAIAAEHDLSPTHEQTNWANIQQLYVHLYELSRNPIVLLNLAAATAMNGNINEALVTLDSVREMLGNTHRFHAVIAHVYKQSGELEKAASSFARAASLATNEPERVYLTMKAAQLKNA